MCEIHFFRGATPRVFRLLLSMAILSFCVPVHAGWFGESDKEKEAKVAAHVADLLREPNKVIALAQDATEAGDTEEAIRQFRKAQEMFESIELSENTTGSAFASLRLKKFHCVSMLDALALKRSEVMDVRQAVTDTSDLETRLAQERAAEAAKQTNAVKRLELPKPPTFADQLADEEKVLADALAANKVAAEALKVVDSEAKVAAEAFAEAARRHSAADAAQFMAEHAVVEAEANALAEDKEGLLSGNDSLTQVRQTSEKAKADLLEAKAALQKAKDRLAPANLRRTSAEAKARQTQEIAKEAQQRVDVLRKAVAAEQAEAKRAQEAEQRRLEADELMRQQAEAQAQAALRARQAEAAKTAVRDAEAKAKVEAEAKALQDEIAWCDELWRLKRVDALEQRLVQAAAKWPDTPEFMVLLARLRLMQGREEDAIELTAMVPAKGEVGVQARMVAAGAYLVRDRPMEAMKLLETSMRECPRNPAPCFNMAVVLLRLPGTDPDRSLAARYYARSVELGGKRSAVLERRLNME